MNRQAARDLALNHAQRAAELSKMISHEQPDINWMGAESELLMNVEMSKMWSALALCSPE